MNTWFFKNLGDAMLAWEALGQIEELFQSSYASCEGPEDLAVFSRYESEGRLHCEVIVYFSPTADVLAREVKARPCQRPAPTGLSLLAGSEESWSTLFPGHDVKK